MYHFKFLLCFMAQAEDVRVQCRALAAMFDNCYQVTFLMIMYLCGTKGQKPFCKLTETLFYYSNRKCTSPYLSCFTHGFLISYD